MEAYLSAQEQETMTLHFHSHIRTISTLAGKCVEQFFGAGTWPLSLRASSIPAKHALHAVAGFLLPSVCGA